MNGSDAIAFLGLGNMGRPMALNLQAAGHRVRAFDIVAGARDASRAMGLDVVESAAEAVSDAAFVITMLPAGGDVLRAYNGDHEAGGLLADAPPDAVLIDCSTIAVDDARAAHEAAAVTGRRCLDAPVSGGVAGAQAGSLTFMVGGEADVLEAAHPLLEVMGRRIVHCGGAGAGQAAKVCNNLILGISMIAVSEAFVLASALGLSDQALFDVASNASGQCWALTSNCPAPGPVPSSPANRDYAAGFAAALMAKDLNLAAHAAQREGLELTLGQDAARLYEQFAEHDGGKDFSAIIADVDSRSGHPRERP